MQASRELRRKASEQAERQKQACSPVPQNLNDLKLSAYGAELSSEACRELGFSSNLLCSSCDLLGEFSLTSLQPMCQQCCQQEAQMETRKLYAGAILESVPSAVSAGFSRCLSMGPPDFCLCFFFSAFVRSEKPKMFKGLQIKYVRGSDPILKLLDDNGNIAEELSITKWNTDSVEEFL
ncbi:hypothetical protein CHARACLAT_025241, partial [Characodon lateralis]|nr:hypothetical protein [Characodon lateralis]